MLCFLSLTIYWFYFYFNPIYEMIFYNFCPQFVQNLTQDVENLQQLLNTTESTIEYLPKEGYEQMINALEVSFYICCFINFVLLEIKRGINSANVSFHNFINVRCVFFRTIRKPYQMVVKGPNDWQRTCLFTYCTTVVKFRLLSILNRWYNYHIAVFILMTCITMNGTMISSHLIIMLTSERQFTGSLPLFVNEY